MRGLSILNFHNFHNLRSFLLLDQWFPFVADVTSRPTHNPREPPGSRERDSSEPRGAEREAEEVGSDQDSYSQIKVRLNPKSGLPGLFS